MRTIEENIKIRQRIITTTKEKGMTQQELLKIAGLNTQFLQGMKRYKLLTENLIKIADALDVSLDYLTGRTENPDSHKL